jgi:hypothetical protein
MVKSMRSSIDSMRDTLNTLNFASKEARQVTIPCIPHTLSLLPPFPPPTISHFSLPQEINNRISAINTRISSIAATAARQSELISLQAAVAKLTADQSARDASVSAAMKDIYTSIRFARTAITLWYAVIRVVTLSRAQTTPRLEDDARSQG